MATKKPLALYSGKTKEMASGDVVKADAINLIQTSAPSAPTDGVTLYTKVQVGNPVLARINAAGEADAFQLALYTKRIELMAATYNNVTPTYIGMTSNTTGTATAATTAVTNTLTRTVRLQYVSAATASAQVYSIGGLTHYRNAGYLLVIRAGFSAVVATQRAFIGMSTGAIGTSTEPSAALNIVGVGKDSSDTNLQFMFNGSSGTALKVDTGIAISTTTIYEVRIFCAPGSGTVYVSVQDLSGSTVIETNNTAQSSVKIPGTTTMCRWIAWGGNGSTAASFTLDLSKGYSETEL